MTIQRNINPKTGLIAFTADGKIGVEQIIDALEKMFDDPGFRKGADVMWDFRQAQIEITDSNEVRKMISYMKKNVDRRGTGYRLALIVARDTDYGIGRMYEAYSEGLYYTVKTFRNESEARSWLKAKE